MDATILRLNRDMIARFRGWLSMLSYEGGKSGGPALGRTSTFCSSAFKDFRKVCIRLSAPCLHLEMVHLPVFTSGKARPLKAACSGAVREFISLRHLSPSICARSKKQASWAMPSSARFMHTWALHKYTK